MLENLVDESVLRDVRGRLDKCPFRHIKPHLEIYGGDITQIVVAANGQDLAVLGAFGVSAKVEGNVLQNVLFELREAGKWKQIILSGSVKPEMRKYGWSLSDIAEDEAIECFYAPPIYFIRFFNKKGGFLVE